MRTDAERWAAHFDACAEMSRAARKSEEARPHTLAILEERKRLLIDGAMLGAVNGLKLMIGPKSPLLPFIEAINPERNEKGMLYLGNAVVIDETLNSDWKLA